MSDQIYIKDLLLRTIIGINPEEREKRQDVLINIILHADTRPAGASDDIEDAVNYRTVTKRVIRRVEDSAFYLVEKMAAEIAAICLEEPGVARATVRVEKPGALRFARSVGVAVERTRADLAAQQVLVSLGANIQPERNLPEAVRRLGRCCRLLAVSPVYETPPVGRTDQPNFLNAAVRLETYRSPAELKGEVLLEIEKELGRVRTADKNAPRTVDLDISLFGDQVLELEGRHIPDPDILEFPHVARPLADLAPGFRHPETGQTLAQIAEGLSDEGLRRRDDIVLGPGSQSALEEA
jgi:2-amino-4-hydroxy-6-hydroxymethyldihydropteridine diphosphokinase